MFLRSQLAKNLTLASLNSKFHSPPGVAKPRLGSPISAQNPIDGFQSNSYQIYPGLPTGFSTASAGLGLIFPFAECARCPEDLNGAPRLGSGHEVIHRHRSPGRTKAFFEPNDGVPGEVSLETFSWPSLLDHADFSTDYLNLMSTEPVIESKQDPLAHVTLSALPVSQPVIRREELTLEHASGTSGHTPEPLSDGLSLFGENGHTGTGSRNRTLDPQSNVADLQKVFRHLRNSPILSINPAQLLSLQSGYRHGFPQDQPETPNVSLEYPEGPEPESKSSTTTAASSPNFFHMSLGSSAPLTAQSLSSLSESTKRSYNKTSDYEPSLSSSPKSSNESTFVPSPPGHKSRSRFTRATKRPAVKREPISPDVSTILPLVGESGKCGISDLTINYGTPVLDAHRGITLSELRAKAERYRLRNRCQEYDKKWLLSFAGKLTPQGLLAENYRCYVMGCNQSNRRRDHIVIHVGGHLDQRPWACKHCPARFLRKNECKRHELSHTGTRPFVCNVCPAGTSAFARQDLLKRHEKRTHNLDTTRGRATKRQRHT